MHELSLVLQVIKSVEKFAESNNLTQISILTLQVGEFSSVLPHYIEACYPAAVEGTILQNAKLIIETVPAYGQCLGCTEVYLLTENKNICPRCGVFDFDIQGGNDFLIKDITAC